MSRPVDVDDVTATVGHRLAVLHLHQRSASLDARESLAAIAVATDPREDLMVLATCHRVEIYAAIRVAASPREWFAMRLPAERSVLDESDLELDGEVARHLFRVACGLDSAVRGEGQILGQVRRVYDTARASRRLHPWLAALFQGALHVARELRGTTPLGTVRRSVGSLAVDEALRLVADPRRAVALVVGAGEVGKLASRALRSRIGSLVIANRDRQRAEALALEIGAEAVGLERIDEALSRADAVISAADTRGTVLTRERLSARVARAPLVLVDIAVPRSVEADAREMRGLVYRSVDDFASEADSSVGGAFEVAERACVEEARAFTARLRAREAAETIRRLHERAERVRRRQLERALARLGHLDERDRRVVEALATGLTNALLHEPTLALRDEPARADAAEELFGLRGRR